MYRKFFGLKKRPFIISPDPDFLYLSRVHDLALTHLEYGIVQNAGFIALTGDIGAGKTTLLKHLFENVKDSLDTAMIFNTNLDPEAFLEMVAREFDLHINGGKKVDLFEALNNHFLKQYRSGRRCVIMVDEAQNLPDETFEELRMLSNLELGSDFLLQIVLVGQPQLKDRLADPSLSQLAQRISVYFHLSGLTKAEVAEYIDHRLKVAGFDKPEAIFEKDATDYISELSGGIPRIINSICDASLTYAYADDIKVVSRALVDKVVEDNPLIELSRGLSQKEQNSVVDSAMEILSCSSDDTGIEMARIMSRIDGLEMRLAALESLGADHAVKVLQEMLSKEREKNLILEKTIAELNYRYKELQSHLRAAHDSSKGRPIREKGGRRFWEVFGGKK